LYVAARDGAAVVIGRRVYKLSFWSLPRFVLTNGYIILRRVMLGLPFEDTEAGYKFFRLATIRPILKQCESHGWFWDTEIVARAYDAGLRITEVPCLFMRRRDKTSTVRPIHDSIQHFTSLLAFRRVRCVQREPPSDHT